VLLGAGYRGNSSVVDGELADSVGIVRGAFETVQAEVGAETLVDLSSFTKNVLLALGVVCAMMAALIVAALSRHLN